MCITQSGVPAQASLRKSLDEGFVQQVERYRIDNEKGASLRRLFSSIDYGIIQAVRGVC